MDIQNWKQLMIFLIVSILDYIIGFTIKWVIEPIYEIEILDFFICINLILSILILIFILYKISSINCQKNKEDVEHYHRNISLIFIAGISLAYIGIIISLFSKGFLNKIIN